MGEWREVTLGQLVAEAGGRIKTGPFGSQLHASDYTDDPGGVPVVMPQDMRDGGIDHTTVKRVPNAIAERLDVHQMASGDIVMARRGDIGRLSPITSEEEGWLCGTGSIRIHAPGGNAVDPKFLRYALAAPATTEWLVGRAVGATMKNLNAEIVGQVPVAIPMVLDLQGRIAAILSAFDELIEINERRIELLENLAWSLYREWFVHFRFPGHEDVEMVDSELGRIPNGWSPGALGDIAEVVVDGIDPVDVDDGRRYVGLEHLPRRHTTLHAWGDIRQVTSRKLEFAEADTLFGKIRPYFHKVVWAPFDGVASSDAIVLRAREDSGSALVNAIAASDQFVAEAVASSNGTKMPRADSTAMLAFTFPLAPADLRLAYETAAQPILRMAAGLVQVNSRLAATRDLLLPRLVTGQLDISDVDLGVLTPAEVE